MYFSKDTPKFSVLQHKDDNKYYIRIRENDEWRYPTWYDVQDGFRTLKDAQDWLSQHDWENATSDHIDVDGEALESYKNEVVEAMQMLGFNRNTDSFFSDKDLPVYDLEVTTESGNDIHVRVMQFADGITVIYWVNGKRLPPSSVPADTNNVSRTIRNIERMLKKYGYEIFASSAISEMKPDVIMAAINTRNLAQNLIKVRSSNVWAYCMNIRDRKDKFGEVLVQFKGPQGGPGDIYIYYDVPVQVWRRWQSALSKGHYFWVYIRNNYKYSKLTGDKRGKLPNAIN